MSFDKGWEELAGLNWHDGSLLHIELAICKTNKMNIELLVEIYPADGPEIKRQRYRIIGKNLKRFSSNLDCTTFTEFRYDGNIDFMRPGWTKRTEKIHLSLFDGYLEAECSKFEYEELPQ